MKRRLSHQLFLFMLLVSVLPMLLIAVIGYTSQKEELTRQVERELRQQSSQITAETSRYLEDRLADTRYLAENDMLRDPFSTATEMREQLNQFLDVHTRYDDVFVIHPRGIVLTDAQSGLYGQDVSSRPWFQQVLAGSAQVSSIYRSPLLDEVVLAFAAPVYDENSELIRILLPIFTIQNFQDDISGFIQNNDAGYAMLMDSGGELLSHPDESLVLEEAYMDEAMLAEADSGTIVTTDSGELVSVAEMGNFPGFEESWYLGVAADEQVLQTPLMNLMISYVAGFGFVLGLLIISVYWLAGRLTDPIRQLVRKSRALASGKREEEAFHGNYREMMELNHSFDAMAQELQEREAFHRRSTLALESSDNGVFAFDRKSGSITLWNRTSAFMFGVPAEEAVSIDDLMIQSGAFRQLTDQVSFNSVKEQQVTLQAEGETRVHSVLTAPLPTKEQEELLVMCYDVTDRQTAEQEMIRSEKLKVVAQMAAGFAHEVRNPLTTIRGFIQLNHQNGTLMSDDSYQLVIDEIDRVNTIIHELLDTADPDADNGHKVTDVNQVLRDVITLQESQLRSRGISWQLMLDPKLPEARVNRNKLKQVLVNLVQNAVEAMPDGGELRTMTDWGDGALVIGIEDTGIGMEQPVIDRLGTPFFTRKATGTGLGLTMSFRYVEEMNGHMSIMSRPGEGSLFTLRLPAAVSERHAAFSE
ncbi:PAS domain-containing sensor histidine kinase [Alkalicoccus luteus]|uniref:histidine kinase n=1 Tax=Alkalicoccus luteus TaxID=1237094 RepID=A0A969TVP6_9BACI|nr:PAS domain-containing sensor histidine kinase [Alkalicoccus luteus]NJP38226.1 PAS domain S-box protein [Alkalicoccus luteus]